MAATLPVLLIDDEPSVSRALVRLLRHHGIPAEGHTEPAEFMAVADTNSHSGLIFDWNLRSCEGSELCAQRRRAGDTRPIALTSAKVTVEHGRELAIAAGADDFIPKSVEPLEWADRVRALLARPPRVPRIRIQGDSVTLDGHVIELRPKEYEVLVCLMERTGEIVSRDELLRRVWGVRTVDRAVLEATMSRLRDKLGRDLIKTLRGRGYRVSKA